MADLRRAAQMALEALGNCTSERGHRCNRCDSEVDEGRKVIDALRAALAAAQEPVAWMDRYGACIPNAMRACMLSDGGASESTALLYTTPLYTHPAPAAQPTPAGWKLVPVEPTPQMVRAGARCASANVCWSEMLAAAPHAPAAQPLTRQQIDDVMTQHYPLSSLLREEVDAFEACVRDIERLHGIGGGNG